eukprot:Skav204122  [mRNA]  locus=scaffold5190:265923:279459:- [translate_table: standard]
MVMLGPCQVKATATTFAQIPPDGELKKAGVDVDVLRADSYRHFPPKPGCTPLHLAARSDGTQMVRMLLRAKASTETTDDSGRTPLDLARARNLPEVMTLLENAVEIAPDHVRALHFRLRERPAVLDNTADISYHGSIKTSARKCWASFPGKYATGWDALIQQLGGDSVGCVFLCTPDDGLGKHHVDPNAAEGSSVRCYCPRIYGTRDFEKFGYLHRVKAPHTQEKMEQAIAKSKFTGAIVVRDDAKESEMEHAKQRAHDAWEKSGRTASWGCEWYHVWLEKVTEAVAQGQRLQVVFFADQVGAGKVAMPDLPEKDLWDGKGLGGSQKAEVATLDLLKATDAGWDYDQIDVADFLRSQFQVGMTVDAWRNDSWCRGTLVSVPASFTAKPEEMFWEINCKSTGKLFKSEHLRHVTDSVQKLLRSVGESVKAIAISDALLGLSAGKTSEATEKLLEAIGHDVLKKMVKERHQVGSGWIRLDQDALPEGIDVGTTSESTARSSNSMPSLAVTVRVPNIERLQRLRDQVLGGDLDSLINAALQKLGCTSAVEVDQALFCEMLEQRLLEFSELTKHQQEVLNRFRKDCRYLHLAAPAGSGKTFLAIQYALDKLRAHPTGCILYVAPSLSLALFFIQWLATRCAADDTPQHRSGTVRALFDRVALLCYPYTELLLPCVEGNRVITKKRCLTKDSAETFLLAIYDEAHHVFRPGYPDVFSAIHARQVLLLSDESQSFLDHTFPGVDMQKQNLEEVLRCTKRVMSGYAEHTVRALWHILVKYRGMSLHRRIALLVPDTNFLDEFRPQLQTALKNNFPRRKFALRSSQESMAFLPKYLCREMSILEDDEVMIFDAVENVIGLEHLFVILIALDSKIEHTGTDAVTWMSPTGLDNLWSRDVTLTAVEEGAVEFKESKALAETESKAAEKLMDDVRGAPRPQPSRSKRRDPSAPKDTQVPRGPTQAEPRTAADASRPRDAGKAAQRATCIWDTDDQLLDEEIPELRFNPLTLVARRSCEDSEPTEIET